MQRIAESETFCLKGETRDLHLRCLIVVSARLWNSYRLPLDHGCRKFNR